MLIIHPEKHNNKENAAVTDALIKRALNGEINLVLENHGLYEQFQKHSNIHSLEGTNQVTTDHLLAIAVWLLDTDVSCIKEIGQLGQLLFVIYVFLSCVFENRSQCEKTQAVIDTVSRNPPLQQTLDTIIPHVTKQSMSTVRGIPGGLELGEIRDFIYKTITKKSQMTIESFAIFHNLIFREHKMYEKLESVHDEKEIDTHVVVGANHVSAFLTDTAVQKMGIDVMTFRKLQTTTDILYPNRRLCDLISNKKMVYTVADE
jgi:hypothetical protein